MVVLPSISLFADTFASMERFDFMVATAVINPEDFPVFCKTFDHNSEFDEQSEAPKNIVSMGDFKGTLWGAAIFTSEEIPVGRILTLPGPTWLTANWGADIATSVPFLKAVGKSYEDIVNPPKRNTHIVRMRTRQDIDEMVADLGPNATSKQMDVWMDEMYPDGHTRRVPVKKD